MAAGKIRGSIWASWISLAPGRSGPALVQVSAPALGAAWRQVNEVGGGEAGRNYSSCLAPAPGEVGHAFPRQCRQGHVQSPHGTRGAAGLATNSSWGPGMALKWVVFRGNGWLGNKVRLEGTPPGALVQLWLLPKNRGHWLPSHGCEGRWVGAGPATCCVPTGGKRRKTRRSWRARRWVLGNRMGRARDMSSESASQQGQCLVSGKPKYQKDSE